MSWNYSNIKAGLGQAIETVPDFVNRVHVTAPEKIHPPCVIIGDGDVEYDDDFDGGDRLSFGVLVVVSRAESRSAQVKLNDYRQRSGANSVKAAIEADPGLPYAGSDTAESVAVLSVTSPETIELGGVSYLACEFSVEVLAT